MVSKITTVLVRWLRAAAFRLRQPEMLALLPALSLAAFWLGGEGALLAAALGVPMVIVLAGFAPLGGGRAEGDVPGVISRGALVAALDDALRAAPETGQATACIVFQLDEAAELRAAWGDAAMAQLSRRITERLRGALRDADMIARLDAGCIAVMLKPSARIDLEAGLQGAVRLQAALEMPISVDAATLRPGFSVGLCLSGRAPQPTGDSMLAAAQAALDEARRNGPGALRAFSPDMTARTTPRHRLQGAVAGAIGNGQIVAHFQPQISTDTGRISGFEALARWDHPDAGTLPPGEFLPAIAAAGLSERLTEVMVTQAMAALRDWDRAGVVVPAVGVNFSPAELSNPQLVEKLRWELDRFGLTPDRLTVEVLETVIADTENDVVMRNLAALSAMGCGIDLDDFGTGHASVAAIRRFAVRRLKIDKSFVSNLAEDREQQKMVAAILSMADRLGLDTVAEGVESTGEHAMLAQLGCRHVQGFAVARAMPLAQTYQWIAQHESRHISPPLLGRRA